MSLPTQHQIERALRLQNVAAAIHKGICYVMSKDEAESQKLEELLRLRESEAEAKRKQLLLQQPQQPKKPAPIETDHDDVVVEKKKAEATQAPKTPGSSSGPSQAAPPKRPSLLATLRKVLNERKRES